MTLDNSTSEYDRAKLAVWDYPVSDKYFNIWWYELKNFENEVDGGNFYDNMTHAIEMVRSSPNKKEGYALIADASDIR